MKIMSVVGGCSRKNRPVGFQFVNNGKNYFLEGSFIIAGGGSSSEESSLSGDFRIGQSFHNYGCKLCGNKFVFQCGHCGSFVCYDGEAANNVECPVCHQKSNVPATRDERIVRSAVKKEIEIVMALDVSSSMEELTSHGKTRLDDAKKSAVENFITQFPDASIAVVTFGTSVSTVCGFTKDQCKLINVVKSLKTRGGTASPLRHIISNYADFVSGKNGTDRYIVLLTDGEWSGSADGHVNTAKELKKKGVQIITIGCAGADMSFLSRVASDGAHIEVRDDDLGGAYATAAKKISQ